MPLPPLSPDSPLLTLICGLGLPEVERYYLSRRYPGCWDFWVLAPGKKEARQRFARLAEAHTAEEQVAFDMLDYFLQKYHPRTRPKEGAFAEGLLGEAGEELTRLLLAGSEHPEIPAAGVAARQVVALHLRPAEAADQGQKG